MKRLQVYCFGLFIFIITAAFVNAPNNTKNTKTIYFNDGVIAIERFYNANGKLTRLKTNYPSGKINEDFNYKEGKLEGKSYKYHTNGKKQVTWEFKDRKLVTRKDHFIPFTEKTKENTLLYHKLLDTLNKKINAGKATVFHHSRRGDLLNRLGFRVLALKELRTVERVVKKNERYKKLPPKFFGNLYDCIARVYSYYELENHAAHYRYLSVKVNPTQTRLTYNLGSYLSEIKSYDLALHYLNETKKIWPKHPFTHKALAGIYLDFGEYEKALEHIQIAFKGEDQLIELGSLTNEKDIRSVRGYIQHKLGNSEEGIKDLNEALRLTPNNSYALRNLGVIYYDLENYKKSCELLTKAKELGFEKIHDQYGLQDYIDISCNTENKTETAKIVDKTNLDNSVAIEDGQPENKLSVFNNSKKPVLFPNPATEIITIKNVISNNFEYQIFSFDSKLVQSGNAENATINITRLAQGVHIINIISNGKNQAIRFIKK